METFSLTIIADTVCCIYQRLEVSVSQRLSLEVGGYSATEQEKAGGVAGFDQMRCARTSLPVEVVRQVLFTLSTATTYCINANSSPTGSTCGPELPLSIRRSSVVTNNGLLARGTQRSSSWSHLNRFITTVEILPLRP